MKLIIVLSLLLASHCAHATEDPDCDPASGLVLDASCLECESPDTQSQMNACAARDFRVADRKLNDTYQDLMSSLSQSHQKALRDEQRAWLKGRDPRCRKEANDEAEGGSMWPMIFESCRAASTQARTQELKQWKLLGIWAGNDRASQAIYEQITITRNHISWGGPNNPNNAYCHTTYSVASQAKSETYPDNSFSLQQGVTYEVFKLKVTPSGCTREHGYFQFALPSNGYPTDSSYAEVIVYGKNNRFLGYHNFSKVESERR